jgi:hypothetical protein
VTINITVKAAFDGSTWQTPRADITWTDITAYVQHSAGVSISRGRSGRRDEVRAGTCSLTLIDRTRRFDPENTAGPYYGFLNPGVPLWVYASELSADVEDVFWGVDDFFWGSEDFVWGAATVYDRFFGFIEDWPQTSPDPADRFVYVPVDATDAFGMLALGRQRSVLENEILADSPLAYWPLDESSGDVMRDRSGHFMDGTYTAGTTGLSGSAGLTLDGEHVGTLPDPLPVNGDALVIEAFVDLSVVSTDDLSDGQRLAICELAGTDVVNWFGFEVRDATSRTVRLVHGCRGATFPGFSASADFIADRPRHVAMRTDGAVAFYVDGVLAPYLSLDPVDVPEYTGTAAGQRIGGSKANGTFRGVLSDVAVFDVSVTGSRVADHAAASLAALDGGTTTERIAYLLDSTGFPDDDRDLTSGFTTLGIADHDGQFTLDLLRRIEKTEQGRFFIGKNGDASFQARYHGQLVATATSATFADDGSEISYSSVEVARPRALVYNKVTVTTDGQSPLVVEDATSTGTHGERETSVDAPLLPTANTQQSLAEYVLANSKDPQLRVTGLSVPIHKDWTTLPSIVLPLEQGDRVAFQRTPVGVGSAIDVEQTLEGYQERFDTTSWTWTPNLSPAEPVTFCVWGTVTWAGTFIWGY